MKVYRLYFLDRNHSVIGAHWLNADDDATALWLAKRLCQACSDLCSGFELRHLARRIDGIRLNAANGDAATAERQRMLAQNLDIIRGSGLPIAHSAKLLASIATGAAAGRGSPSEEMR